MPRTVAQRPIAIAEPTANSMIASAANLTQDGLDPFRRKPSVQAWQTEAWGCYDTIGELRAAANWMGNALSRVKLVIKQRTPDGGVQTLHEGLAVDALAALFGGSEGQSQMMSLFGIHLTVPGESYLVGEPQGRNQPDNWMVLSTEEIGNTQGSTWTINRGAGKQDLAPNSLIIRIWRPHPRTWIEADSSVRAVLPILREILQLTKHVAATIDSRLAGAGLLLLPSEMTFAAPKDDQDPADPQSDPFFAAFVDAMMTPIEDRASAAAVVPLVLRAPGAVLSTAQHISFSTPFDAAAQGLREEAIKRVALGMDMPPEIMLGSGQTNHWASWNIDESAIKIHVEPICALIASALTEKWLWPVLDAGGQPAPDTFVGWDTSDLRIRPNHATEAIELYDRGELSPDALRRETGFDESDAPTPIELQRVMLIKLVGANNDLTAGAARALGVNVDAQDVGNRNQPVAPPVVEAPTGRDRNLPDQEQQTREQQQRDRNAAALAAAEMLVLRALERANNRLNNRGKRARVYTVEECEVGLRDAWTYVPHLAESLGWNPDWLENQLDQYTRAVLCHEVEHCPEALSTYLSTEHQVALVHG